MFQLHVVCELIEGGVAFFLRIVHPCIKYAISCARAGTLDVYDIIVLVKWEDSYELLNNCSRAGIKNDDSEL